jgi:hypothetical protein
MGVTVAGHQVGESTGGFDNALGMLVEKLKKIALFGQQFAEQHE